MEKKTTFFLPDDSSRVTSRSIYTWHEIRTEQGQHAPYPSRERTVGREGTRELANSPPRRPSQHRSPRRHTCTTQQRRPISTRLDLSHLAIPSRTHVLSAALPSVLSTTTSAPSPPSDSSCAPPAWPPPPSFLSPSASGRGWTAAISSAKDWTWEGLPQRPAIAHTGGEGRGEDEEVRRERNRHGQLEPARDRTWATPRESWERGFKGWKGGGTYRGRERRDESGKAWVRVRLTSWGVRWLEG